MFDQYIICDDSLRLADDGSGATIDVRMPYYRGLGLSMVEGVDLIIDGAAIPPGSTTFTVHGNTYPTDHLAEVLDDRWEMGEPARLGFPVPAPLNSGDHMVTVVVRLRISYMPVPGGGRDTKTLRLP